MTDSTQCATTRPPMPPRSTPLMKESSGQRVSRYAAVTLYTGTLLFPRAAFMGPLSHHEVLYTLSAREETPADWRSAGPHNLGLPWTEKPPGVQWIYALAIALTGSTSEIAVRLPSVLAGTGLACLVAALASRRFGPLAGRAVRSDPGNDAEHAASGAAGGSRDALDPGRGRSDGLFSAGLRRWAAGQGQIHGQVAALAILSLPGRLVPAQGTGRAVFRAGSMRRIYALAAPTERASVFCSIPWASAWARHPLGVGCSRLLALPVVSGRPRAASFWPHAWRVGGGKSPFYYLYTMLFVLLPWTPAVAWGVAQAWRQGQLRQPFWKFTLCWLVPGLSLLHASAFKKSHYLSPLLPPLTILAALGLSFFVGGFRRRDWRQFALCAVPVMLGCLIAVAAIILGQCPDPWPLCSSSRSSNGAAGLNRFREPRSGRAT